MKKSKLLFIMLLMFCVVSASLPMTAAATENGWRQAYLDFIEQDTQGEPDLRGSAKYQLIYIDDDDIPELWIDYGFTYAGGKICTFDGKQVNSVWTWTYGGFQYIERGGSFYTAGGHMDVYYDEVYTLQNGEFVRTARGDYETPNYTNPASYKWNGKTVTEAQYQRSLSVAFDFSSAVSIDYSDSYCYVDICLELNRIAGISLNKYSMFLEVGKQETLRITTIIDGSAASFKSSDTSVAVVDYSGVVTAVGEGTAIITVTEEVWGNTARCTVTVSKKSGSVSFADVASTAYYYDAVIWAVENGICYINDRFYPNDPCSREEIVTMLWRAAGCPKPLSTSQTFTDVRTDRWSYEAVQWAVEQGITCGTSATTFSPADTVTRAQAMTFLHRLAGTPSASGSTFKDVPSNSYYAEAVRWAVKHDITYGTTSTTFSPDQLCTRCQIVTFLYRYYVGN